MKKQVNAALQVIPKSAPKEMYGIIDKAIEKIADSGLRYQVCPFETVVEGPQDKIFELIDTLQQTVLSAGADEVLINIKLHAGKEDMHIEDKMEKYDS